jgi:hypothetical protein
MMVKPPGKTGVGHRVGVWLGGTTLPPPGKRRRVSGAWPQVDLLQATVRVQRAWRRSRAIRNDQDPATQDPVPLGPRRFVLVESSTVAYKFDGPTFAASVLCSGSFEHPVVRRQLVAPEVTRLGRAAGLGPFGREALKIAFDYRTKARKHAMEQASLVGFLEGEAGTALHDALDRAEFFGMADMVVDGVETYSDALDAVVMSRPRAVRPLVEMHRAVVAGRREAWGEIKSVLYDVMFDARQEADDHLRARRGRAKPLTALGDWIAPSA